MNNFIKNTIAVVVVYNKDLLQSETLISLGIDLNSLGLKLDLFIYDNSNEKQKEHKVKGFNIVNHFYNGLNVGVGAAYNEAAKFAVSNNKKWMLLLDQDTSFEQGAVNEYFNNTISNPDINLFAPIIKIENGSFFSPFRKVFMRGITLKKVEPVRYNLKKVSPVNSGILISTSSFVEAGGYNEKVKLDFSDIEFIRRFSYFNKEFKIINTICIQDFSNTEIDIKKLNVRFHFFCDGVKHCYRKNFVEDLQYLIVVLIRMTVLIIRTKKIIFVKTFYNSYLK